MSTIVEQIIVKTILDDSQAQGSLKRFDKNVKQAKKSTDLWKKSLQLLGAVGVVTSLKSLVQSSIQVNSELDKLNRSLTQTLGTAGAAAAEINFLSNTADQLGLNLLKTAGQYAKFLAASKGNLSLEESREIFLGIAEASAVLGLSAQDAEGALRAIQQTASKGRVSLEELTGQLGERLPGSLQAAAKGLGVTDQELIKMVENGEVLAKDLLPALGKELRETFSAAAKDTDTLQANLNRIANSFNKLLESDSINTIVGGFATLAEKIAESEESLRGLGEQFREVVNFAAGLIGGTGEDERFGPLNLSPEDIARGKAEQAARGAAKAAAAAAAEQKKMNERLKLFIELSDITEDNVIARNLEFIRKETGLTSESFDRLKGPITEALKRGEGFDKILNDIKKVITDIDNFDIEGFSEFEFENTILDRWKTFADTVGLGVKGMQDLLKATKDIKNPFDTILDNAQDFRDALNLANELGLTRQEFDALKSTIMEAKELGLSDEQIAERIEELRRDQILGRKGRGEEFLGSSANTAIEVGSAQQQALNQQLKLDSKIAENSERSAKSLEGIFEEIRENGLIGITGSISN